MCTPCPLGEEIISGAQRIHIPEFLEQRAQACGIDVKTISTYIDSFRYFPSPLLLVFNISVLYVITCVLSLPLLLSAGYYNFLGKKNVLSKH